MKTLTKIRNATLLATLLVPSFGAAQVVAYHDATGAAHQTQFAALSNQGYRMISLTIYGTTSDLRYGAVWVHRAGPPFVGFHGINGTDYQSFVNTWCPQGYVPKVLSATGSGSGERFAGVFEQTGAPCYIRHGLDETSFWNEVQSARDNGWRISTADIYGSTSSPRYIVAFEHPPSNQLDSGQAYAVSNGVASYQQHFDAFVQTWARPRLVAFNDSDRFLSVWQNDQVGAWTAHHDMTASQYQSYFNTYMGQGMYPINLSASGSGSSRRFAAVWAHTDLPLARNFSATGAAVPELAMFDNWARDWMMNNDARAASLAIVKNGRLVLARGYNYAETGYPQTQPTSLFRIASCSKPLTSISIHQHFQAMPNQINPQTTLLSLLNEPQVADARTYNITMRELLTHQGGWDRDVSFDPMFRDTTIASTLGIGIPISKYDVRRYMTSTQMLDFTPGTQSKYSNYGFSLLGQVIERLEPGLAYEQVIDRDILQPLGLTRPQIGHGLLSQALPGEVRYHPTNPWIAQSVETAARPWVGAQYGGYNFENMDSHGSWVMAAPDFAKVLAAFDLGGANPLLNQTWTTHMFSLEPGYSSVMRGWFRKNVSDGNGGTVAMAHHNGKLGGTATLVARRDDGISFVFFTNSDSWLNGTVEGVQLSDLANTVRTWPNLDLFPRVGIPAFRRFVPGGFSTYGSGCGIVGAAAPTASGSGSPETAQEFSFDLSGAPAGAPALGMVSFDRTPIGLGVIGAPACTLYGTPVASFGSTTGRTGTAAVSLMCPDEPSLVGSYVFGQFAVVLSTPAGPQLAMTNGVAAHLGGFQ